jgi:hypothetical protein
MESLQQEGFHQVGCQNGFHLGNSIGAEVRTGGSPKWAQCMIPKPVEHLDNLILGGFSIQTHNAALEEI